MSDIEKTSLQSINHLEERRHLEERLMELEIRSALQEDTIEQLNQVIFKQQQQIDAFERHLTHLKAQLSSLQEATAKESEETPPPHY